MSNRDTSDVSPDEPGDRDVVAEAEEILSDSGDDLVATLERERDDYLEALQRLQADFENYRKRVARTSEDVAARTATDVVSKLLPVLDALDLAQAHFGSADTSELDSLEARALVQARSLLLDTLVKEGLARIDEIGVAFDPHQHDAVAHVADESDDASGEQIVDDVLRAGYTWRGSVIRPAMVRVKG